MSSITGNSIKISIFGESHSQYIGMTIDGLPSGIKIDKDFIDDELSKRRPIEEISTSRVESDKYTFISGVFNGYTTGAPITFLIENNDINSDDYKKGEIRPSHADLSTYLKYSGYNDYRGGGFTSGRITASLVILGAICRQLLLSKGIIIGSHISELHNIVDDSFNKEKLYDQLNSLNKKMFPVLNNETENLMKKEIKLAKENNDSVGGIIESAIINLPIGLGEPFFDSIESTISKLLFSIGGIKGVMFGDGLDFAKKYGSELNDQLYFENNKIIFKSNHNGGINGGLSNGEPIIIKSIVKPTPSIGKTQKSINIENKENIDLNIKGRHDPCFVNRVREVIDSVLSYAILDLLLQDKSRHL